MLLVSFIIIEKLQQSDDLLKLVKKYKSYDCIVERNIESAILH